MPDIQRWQPTVRMHQAVAYNNLLFTAGQVARTSGGASVAEQTAEILDQIDGILIEAGTDRKHVLSATVFLADMKHFAEMNSIWDAWVAPDGKPARTTVEARLTEPQFSVEISVIAAM